ncbi:MAG TPA: DUF2272 domain-containing protein [Rhizomicrobium sp.]|jgi:hypothetical protein|nr:DUF2272 domain-containing protein [Rhizomicrobium sp.]
MTERLPAAAAASLLLFLSSIAAALATPRLPQNVFDVIPPPDRVEGPRGYMKIKEPRCRVGPTADARRRIVDIAVQEWAFFGSHSVDVSHTAFNALPQGMSVEQQPAETVAPVDPAMDTTIAGYWSATPDGAAVLAKQNALWYAAGGGPARWVEPWSAAFVSWVMCEAGLGDMRQFQRSIAHRDYIDQAIRTRDGQEMYGAYNAFDPGERPIEPGDLLCDVLTSARFQYRTVEDRRRDMGSYAPAHCDIVVKLAADRILVVGGNILGAVTLAVWPTERAPAGYLRPVPAIQIDGIRNVFAHLKLRANPIEWNAMDNSPTIRALKQAPAPTISSKPASTAGKAE